jgi:N-acetylneuraminic acid mutarotase/pimeloyl-ACP methyl ester carboxylesterase
MRNRSRLALVLSLGIAACATEPHSSSIPNSGKSPLNTVLASPSSAISGCAYCIFGPRRYIRSISTPATDRSTISGDPQADYLIDIDDGGSEGADGSVVLNGKVLLAPRTRADVGPRHIRQAVTLLAQNFLDVRLTGAPGSVLTVYILGGVEVLSAGGGTVTAPGSGATITVPPGAITGGELLVQLADTLGITGIYPALADRGYRLSFAPGPNTTFETTKKLQVSLPITRAPGPSEKAVASIVIGGNTFWASESGTQILTAASKAARAGTASVIASTPSPAFAFTIPVASIRPLGSLPGATAGSTPMIMIILPQWLSLSTVTCSANQYPPSAWVGAPPIGRDLASKDPIAGDIGIVLVEGWNKDLGDCQHFRTIGISGEEYFKELVGPLRSQFGASHPLWAFTYPTFYQISKSGTELAQELTRLVSTHQLSGLIIVAHSMGGLVARIAAEELEGASTTRGRLRGIITLGTPHIGTPFADPFSILAQYLPVLPGLDTPGGHDLISGLDSRVVEEVPLFASSGDIHGVGSVDPVLHWIDLQYATINLRSDGVVPTYSASPAFISKGRAYPPISYDHYELHQGDNGAGDPTDPLFQRIFADIRSLLPSTPATWLSRQPIPTALGDVVATELNGHVFTFGGAFHPGGAFSGTCCTSSVFEYDPIGDTWSQRSSIPPLIIGSTRSASGIAILNGQIYAVGGTTELGLRNDLLVYSPPPVDSWSFVQGGETPIPLAGGIFGNINDKLYLYVGLAQLGLTWQQANLMYVYEPSSKSWTQLPSPPQEHYGGVGGVIGGRFLLIGGNGTQGCHGVVDVFDPVLEEWTTRSHPLPTVRCSAASAVLGSRMFVAGGYTPSSSVSGIVEAYDAASDSWSSLPSLNTPRFGFGLAAVGATLYAIGGHTFAGCPCTGGVESLDVSGLP